MSNRKLPKAQIPVLSNMHTAASPKALDHWRPEMQAAQTGDGTATIPILDVIGEDFWTGQGVTSARVAAALQQIGNREVTVTINSPGGDYIEGLAIYNLLRDHPAKVTVKIVGLAASCAASIAMAGDEILIARAGFLMIHNVWVMAIGDRNVLRETAAWLEPFDQVFVDIFSARTGMDPKEIARMLDRETYIGGAEAVQQKFADSFLPADEVVQRDTSKTKALRAERIIESSLKAQGLSSRDGKMLLAQMKGVARDADLTAARDAGVIAGLESILQNAKQI